MTKQVVLIIALVMILGTGGTVILSKIRGIRNNNPGNIRRNNTPWVGLADAQTDSSFFQFIKPEFGIRAIAKILIDYQDKHGLVTIRQWITRWAPPVENNTASYVAAVASEIGASADAPLDVRAVMFPLVTEIIRHENGIQPYSRQTIAFGLSKAGVIV